MPAKCTTPMVCVCMHGYTYGTRACVLEQIYAVHSYLGSMGPKGAHKTEIFITTACITCIGTIVKFVFQLVSFSAESQGCRKQFLAIRPLIIYKIPHLFHGPYKNPHSSSVINPVFHWYQ